MKYRLVTLIFLILITISCAGSKIHYEVRQPDGRPFPNPFYVLQTTDPQRPIRVSFFYSSLEAVKDLDQTIIQRQKFLDRRTEYYFSSSSHHQLHLTVRVLNPQNMKYKVFSKQRIEFSDGRIMDIYSQIALSNMKYREFSPVLPTSDGVKEARYSLEVVDENNNLLISTGNFHYYVS